MNTAQCAGAVLQVGAALLADVLNVQVGAASSLARNMVFVY